MDGKINLITCDDESALYVQSGNDNSMTVSIVRGGKWLSVHLTESELLDLKVQICETLKFVEND
jgi:hypothetical protein